MRLMPSDPDLKTIITRVFEGDINLQPDFQRGEVWGTTKKVRLIDSILREWHIPPIHVIEIKETGRQEVLDGQQRLAAIRDFVKNEVMIDGYIEPVNNDIADIHGLTYSDLPNYWRRKFDKFTIRVYNITDYEPSEPGELFYRLNQPTNLTSAEQRNAYYGPAREQIKYIVSLFEEIGLSKREIGFSNSRMAYDDVIARLCVYLEYETLGEKITASTLADKYRAGKGFSSEISNYVIGALVTFSKSTKYFDGDIKFNKATLLSWLCFIVQLHRSQIDISPNILGRFIYQFETSRSSMKAGINIFSLDTDILVELLNIFNDRASSRVADVMSVLIRDVVIWTLFFVFCQKENGATYQIDKQRKIDELLNSIHNNKLNIAEELNIFINGTKWGKKI
jgi:hypothetical protein